MKKPELEQLISLVAGADLSKNQRVYAITQYNDLMHYVKQLESERQGIINALPSETEIDKWVEDHGYYGHCTSEYHEGLEEGAKWMKDQIKQALRNAGGTEE